MNVKILALMLSVALTGAAEARNDSKFRASAETVAEVQNNGALPPTAAYADAAARFTAWKHTFKTMFDSHTVAKSCLAQAVYFEARSESELGQLAVATVILNRAKTENYPSSICGVVYQGASRLTGCQFSFTCDSQPNLAQIDRAWETALTVTTLALANDSKPRSVAAATHYHADYVDPYWSKSMNRLTKIGRHIFYSQG